MSTVTKAQVYNLPKGYTLARVLLRSLRMGTHPIEVISKNVEKFGGTYSLLFPGNQRLIIIVLNIHPL
jgi:hypothetical protein